MILIKEISPLKYSLLLWVLAFSSMCIAEEKVCVRNLSVSEGLSNDFVLNMTTDGYGFVWVGTKNGLNRITGYGVMKYTEKSSKLVDNMVNSLCYERKQNAMWVGTLKGITIVDCQSGLMKNLNIESGLAQNMIADIKPAADGGIWILYMHNGIQYYDVRHKRLVRQEAVVNNALRKPSHCCLDSGTGLLYVGHNGAGMSVVDLKRHRVENYRHRSGDPSSLPSDNVRRIVSDRHGNVWVGTSNGLAMFDPLSRRFHRLVGGGPDRIGDNIYDMSFTNDGRLLVACNLDGVSIVDVRGTAWTGGMSEPASRRVQAEGMGGMSRVVLNDSFGNVWVGSYGEGVSFINPRPTPFSILPGTNKNTGDGTGYAYGIAASRNAGLWVGTNGEIWLYRNAKMVGRWRFTKVLNRSSAFVYVLYEDHAGNLWMGLDDEGVVVFDPLGKKFRKINIADRALDIHAFLEMPDGSMLIGSELGLYRYKEGKVTFMKRLSGQLPSPTIYGLACDHHGRLWVGTDGGGVCVFAHSGERVARIDETNGLPTARVNQLLVGKDGAMWIATSGGLCRLPDVDNLHKIDIYDGGNGLPDPNIMGVVQYADGQIWVSTYSNIAKLDMVGAAFSVFDFKVGVPAGGFVEGSAALATDGCLYFGSPKGVCRVDNRLLRLQPKAPSIHVVGCETVAADTRHLVPLSPDGDGVYRMAYNSSTIRIAFSVADYGRNGRVEFVYKMEGLADDWIFTEGSNEVTFRNLRPGKYVFKVKARLLGGKFDEANIASVPIVVTPPWWATWWMYAIYVLLAVGIVVAVTRVYRRRLKLENSLKLRDASLELERANRQKEKEINENRLRFFTNIAHELRTPLTLTIGPVDDLRHAADMPPAYRSKLTVVYQNAVRLLGLINRLMEFRKAETGNSVLAVTKADLCQVVREIGMRFAEGRTDDGVSFAIEVLDEYIPIYFDSDVVAHILDNLLSNAFKYTPIGGRVCLSLTTDERWVNIAVSDTGSGISAEALPHIFDRYYQEKGKHRASGTGIGLALVKSLIELHQAKMEVDSELGQGTTFVLHLDRHNTYPNVKHKQEKSLDEMEDTPVAEGREATKAEVLERSMKPTLLVVDDNEDLRTYIARELADTFDVSTASDGLVALNMAHKKTPDVVVSDVMMPQMDGVELCRRLKEDIRTSHVIVVLLTAKTTNEDREEGYRCGADSYLSKPFSAGMLKARVCNLLEARKKLAGLLVAGRLSVTGDVPNTDDMGGLSLIDRKFVNSFAALVSENLADSELDMSFFTDRLNMSYSSFYRKVKSLCGMSPNEYLRKMRLKRSAELLASRSFSVTDVAQMSGFDNMGHFRKCFKEEYGTAPSDYMRTGKNGNTHSDGV